MNGAVRMTTAGLLLRAQQALGAVEREESGERQKLTLLEAREEQLALEIRRGLAQLALAPATTESARPRLEELIRAKEECARRRAEQWSALRGVRDRVHTGRRAYEEVQRHALELQQAIRPEERAVTQWQRQIRDTEEPLARRQRMLMEAQARLEEAERKLGDLGHGARAAGLPG